MTLVFDSNRCREVKRLKLQPYGDQCELCDFGPCKVAVPRAPGIVITGGHGVTMEGNVAHPFPETEPLIQPEKLP